MSDSEYHIEADLNQDYLDKLHALGKNRVIKSKGYIFFQGDKATHVYVLSRGIVKSTQIDENGHEALLKRHGPGSVIGLSALRPAAIRDANAIANEEIEVTSLSRKELFQYIRDDGELGILLIQLLLKRQQALHSRVSDVVSHSIEQRLAQVLLQLSAEIVTSSSLNEKVSISISHEDLAALVMSRRQYVTAILRSFVAEGLIYNTRGRIVILDSAKLRAVFSRSTGTNLK